MTFLDILPDLLRSSATVISILLLFPVLSKKQLKTKTHVLMILGTVAFVLALSARLYLSKNYTGVVYTSLFFYLLLIIGFKFIFKEKLFQWLFNSVTVLNVYAIVVIISYFLAFKLPYQQYGITLIRLVLFALTYLVFKKYIRPLYLDVSENWAAFLLPTTGILASYLYILLSLGDVESSMTENLRYFYLITLITVFSYIAIMSSLKSLRAKFLLREDNIKSQANEDLLKSEIVAYESTVTSAKQTRHDIRHHNSILIEYLNSKDIDGAKEYLKVYDDSIEESAIRNFSKHPIANAVFRIYDRRSRDHQIEFLVHAEADNLLSHRLPDIGAILSNIFENALLSCQQCTCEHTYIHYTSIVENDSILIEIKNSVGMKLQFENGLPVTTKSGGGTGLVSVKRMVDKYQGMLAFKQEHQEFITQIILPIVI